MCVCECMCVCVYVCLYVCIIIYFILASFSCLFIFFYNVMRHLYAYGPSSLK